MPVALSERVTILPATWRDLGVVMGLEKICFPHDAWPWIDILAALSFPGTVRFMALWGETPVGFVIGDRRRRERVGWISSIGVHPDFRRRGIALRLLAACEQSLDMERLRLTLRVSNEAAFKLYQSAGYAQIDLWRRYYLDGEDAIVMEKAGQAPGRPDGA